VPLSRIMQGFAQDHQTDYYDVRDQRFLGDERFVEEIEGKVQGNREIALPVPRVKIALLLPLVARAYGRQRKSWSKRGGSGNG
jgi:hypothetical protein